jgi:hypothetical protein
MKRVTGRTEKRLSSGDAQKGRGVKNLMNAE